MVFEELLNFDERIKVKRKMKMIVLLSSLLLGILVSGFRQGSKVYGLGRSSLKSLRLELVGDVCSFSDRTLKLRTLLQQKQLSVMPCCYDGLSARMIESAGINYFLEIISSLNIAISCRLQHHIYDRIWSKRNLWVSRYGSGYGQ